LSDPPHSLAESAIPALLQRSLVRFFVRDYLAIKQETGAPMIFWLSSPPSFYFILALPTVCADCLCPIVA
jgi:hypothetical protein